MTLGELIENTGARLQDPADAAVRICDITEDSRTVLPGSLFVARAGATSDGRRFIGAAVEAGAAAVLTDRPFDAPGRHPRAAVVLAEDAQAAAAAIAERFFGRPSRALKLIGITGTNGKTTTAHAVHRLLNASRIRCGLIGTVVVDDGTEVAEATLTTPPAIEMSCTLARMVEAGCDAAVMEVSSHALEQRRVASLDFDVAVFTNLTGDHLDYHGTMESYAAAKRRLFAMLGPSCTAVVNADDPWSQRMTEGCGARVLRCALDRTAGADCTARALSAGVRETDAEFSGPWGEIRAVIPFVGRHNLMNCLQGIAAAHAAGAGAERLRHAATLLEPPPGRLERVEWPEGRAERFTVLVDYAHTDDALRNVLTALRPLVPSGAHLSVVFGCGGDRDRSKRPRMGRVCRELADRVFVTSDNPRTEQPRAIIREILGGIDGARRAGVVVDAERDSANQSAIDGAEPGDVVLIAGKGHETYQLLPDGAGGIIRRDFDDRLIARRALERRLAREREDTARPVEGAARP